MLPFLKWAAAPVLGVALISFGDSPQATAQGFGLHIGGAGISVGSYGPGIGFGHPAYHPAYGVRSYGVYRPSYGVYRPSYGLYSAPYRYHAPVVHPGYRVLPPVVRGYRGPIHPVRRYRVYGF